MGLLLNRGDSQSALEWSGRAIRLFRSLALRDPRNLDIARTQLWDAPSRMKSRDV